QQETVRAMPRSGGPGRIPALVRARIVALACSKPAAHGKVWKRWSGEKLAQVAVEEGIVSAVSPNPIRRWLRQDKLQPWRSHSWQPSTDPQFVEKAPPVLDLYEAAPRLTTQQEGGCWGDEKTSIQPRQRVHDTKAAG